MVRIPRSWARAGYPTRYSGAVPSPYRGAAVRRIPVPPEHLYVHEVTVDLGNDGMAPQVTFTAGGTAQASVGPSSGGDVWSLDQCQISTSIGQLDAAQATLYNGPLPLPQYAITASLAGGFSQFGLGGVAVPFGWFVYVLWTGGTAGAFGYLRLTGQKTVLSN